MNLSLEFMMRMTICLLSLPLAPFCNKIQLLSGMCSEMLLFQCHKSGLEISTSMHQEYSNMHLILREVSVNDIGVT
jgi:hypothetical protein